jgi:dTDP-4-dehydrorhamnose reductase
METVLVTGATGLLGSSLVPLLKVRGFEVITHARSGSADVLADLSVTDKVFKLLDKNRPEIIINLAGLTDVDRCEALPSLAYSANVHTVENIVNWIRKKNTHCHLVHISTDMVYDGVGPHTEDTVSLTNCYAFSKYASELAAASAPSTILRTNFFGRSHRETRTSLTDWLFHSLSNSDSIQVFDDVLFSPLAMDTLSNMIELIIRKKPVGVFNLGTHGGISKSDFAFAFAEELKLSAGIMTRTSTDQVTFLKTYRPKDMRMDCSKFENTLAIKLPFLRNEIKRVAREYYEEA